MSSRQSPDSVRAVQGTVLALLANAAAAVVIIVFGEVLFRGAAATLQWLKDTPGACLAISSYLLLCLYALQLFLSRHGAWLLCAVVVWAFSLAGMVKMAKLGSPITPNDLLILRQVIPTSRMLWGWVPLAMGAALVAVAAHSLWKRRARLFRADLPGWPATVVSLACALAAVALVTEPDFNFKNSRFRKSVVAEQLDRIGVHNLNWSAHDNASANGQVLSFLMNLQSILMPVPVRYGKAQIDRIVGNALDHCTSTPAPPAAIQAQDVIVIMNEAWWDPRKLPGVRFDDPLLANLDITSSGLLFSPTFGGYTANTEFEFLSRMPIAFLPSGSIPYQQYIDRPTASLASDFAANGFKPIAIHPFDGTFWNRAHAYPLLGFSTFVTEREFIDPDTRPPFISDLALATKIGSMIDASPGERHFVFAVSMQNHGAYGDGATRYEGHARVRLLEGQQRLGKDGSETLGTYATGVRDAVASFNQVVSHARDSGRRTLVVMFGDHLPYLGDNYDLYVRSRYLSSADQSSWSASDRHRMHEVPVVAWSNLPQGISLPVSSRSPVFLGSAIKQAAGIPGSLIDAVLADVANETTILTQFYNESARRPAGAPDQRDDALDDYRMLAYDQLFGAGYSTAALRWGSCAGGTSATTSRARH